MGSRFHLTDEETGLEMLSKLAYQVGQLGLKINNSLLVKLQNFFSLRPGFVQYSYDSSPQLSVVGDQRALSVTVKIHHDLFSCLGSS